MTFSNTKAYKVTIYIYIYTYIYIHMHIHINLDYDNTEDIFVIKHPQCS